MLWIVIAVLAVMCVVFMAVTVFLGTEMLKKFKFWMDFTFSEVGDSVQRFDWHYPGKKPPGMYSVVFFSNEPFEVLIGFTLRLAGTTGVDFYGFVASKPCGDEGHRAVISTFLGRGSADFVFLARKPKDEPVGWMIDDEGKLSPQQIYPPHWYQKWGFYA